MPAFVIPTKSSFDWRKAPVNPKVFGRGDATRFTAGCLDLLIVKRVGGAKVKTHATLTVAGTQPITFRTPKAAFAAAEGIKRILDSGVAVNWPEAVRLWKATRASKSSSGRLRRRMRLATSGGTRTPKRSGPRARVEKTAGLVAREMRAVKRDRHQRYFEPLSW